MLILSSDNGTGQHSELNPAPWEKERGWNVMVGEQHNEKRERTEKEGAIEVSLLISQLKDGD